MRENEKPEVSEVPAEVRPEAAISLGQLSIYGVQLELGDVLSESQ